MRSPLRPTTYRALFRATSATALVALFLGGPLTAAAHADSVLVPLGTASAFSVLAGSTVTNTGTTTVSRSVGLHPGTAVTGSTSMVVGGTYHVTDAVALKAKDDLTTGFTNAAGQGPRNSVPADLVGLTLPGGVYNTAGAMGLTGELVLDGENDPAKVWVFQAGSTLITGPGAVVRFINGGNPCNVFWQVGSSATLDTTTSFIGTIMANATITMNTGATLQGRALARTGAVNLHSNVITGTNCANDVEVADGTATPPTPAPTPTPTPTPTAGNGGTGGTGGTGTTTTDGGTGSATDTQVTTTPVGSVDTGYVGPTSTNDGTQGILLGSGLFAVVGGLALLAVRRRQRV